MRISSPACSGHVVRNNSPLAEGRLGEEDVHVHVHGHGEATCVQDTFLEDGPDLVEIQGEGEREVQPLEPIVERGVVLRGEPLNLEDGRVFLGYKRCPSLRGHTGLSLVVLIVLERPLVPCRDADETSESPECVGGLEPCGGLCGIELRGRPAKPDTDGVCRGNVEGHDRVWQRYG